MDAACDYCEQGRATVYCRADSARLCLSCDRHVHSANALSLRHVRTLLCDGCNLRPAVVRCPVENLAFCQSCDWDSHGNSPIASQHRRHAFDCFSGCPSAAELGSLWGCDLVPSSVESRGVSTATRAAAPRNLQGFVNSNGSSYGGPGKVATFASMSAAAAAGGPPLLAKVCSMLSKSMVLSDQECVLLQEKPWELPFLAHIWVFTSEERLTLESQKPFFFFQFSTWRACCVKVSHYSNLPMDQHKQERQAGQALAQSRV